MKSDIEIDDPIILFVWETTHTHIVEIECFAQAHCVDNYAIQM